MYLSQWLNILKNRHSLRRSSRQRATSVHRVTETLEDRSLLSAFDLQHLIAESQLNMPLNTRYYTVSLSNATKAFASESDQSLVAFNSGTASEPMPPYLKPIYFRGPDYIDLDWNPVPNATEYRLLRWSVDKPEWKQIYFGQETNKRDFGAHLIKGVDYLYSVQAIVAGQLSSPSEIRASWITPTGSYSSNQSFVTTLTDSVSGIDPVSHLYRNGKFPVFLKALIGEIDPNKETWILIHGYDSRPSDWANELGGLIHQSRQEDSVLIFDWSAAQQLLPGIEAGVSENRIKPVAEALSESLIALGFNPQRINLMDIAMDRTSLMK